MGKLSAGMAEDASAGDAKPVVAPPASWARPLFFDRQAAAIVDPDSKADYHWLLKEKQVNAASDESFLHVSRKYLTTSGLQYGANLSISFDPGYQSLTLHWIRLWRGTNILNRLDLDKIKMVRREKDIEQFLMDGRQSAVLVLEDVRVGDILDYAYTIKGENPVFAGHFSDAVTVQPEQPFDHLMTRVLWPSNRHLFARAHACIAQPALVTRSNILEYTWDFKRTAALHIEDSLPKWYDPEPWVQLSEFKTWAEVNQWALSLFKSNTPPSGEFSAKIAAWKRIGSKDEQVLAVLKFVQDEVRYFGIEIGASSMRPADASTVFARRYGDCKDKSFLFVSVCRALGIEAYPVLVNSTLGQTIEQWQPTATAFDHCIVEVQINGQKYWLDPTMNFQGGTIQTRCVPNYGRGLVISPRTTGLSESPPINGMPKTTSLEYFHLHGKTEAAELKVVSIAEGRDADTLRDSLSGTKRADLEKSFLHYYTDRFPGATVQSPLTIEDDEQQNKITTTEYYSIKNFWNKSEKDFTYSCSFYPASISSLLKKPVETNRRQPLGINYPEHLLLRTEVTLPDAWPAETDFKNFVAPGFSLRKNINCTGRTLLMEYEYTALADSITPEQVPQYIERVNQANESLGRSLTWRY